MSESVKMYIVRPDNTVRLLESASTGIHHIPGNRYIRRVPKSELLDRIKELEDE